MKAINIILTLTIYLLCIACKEEQNTTTLMKVETTQSISTKQNTYKNNNNNSSKKEKETTTNTNKNPMNLLDEQAKIYSDVFGNLGGVEELQDIEGYLDLVKKMDAPPETKKQLTEQYELYNNSLDPEKKELVKTQLNSMLLEALNKNN